MCHCECVGVWIQVRALQRVCGCVDTGTCVTVSVWVCGYRYVRHCECVGVGRWVCRCGYRGSRTLCFAFCFFA